MARNKRIEDYGVVAVVRLDDLANAVPLTEALIAGGVRAVEFTFTNPRAGQAIETVRAAVGDRGWIGAGTVLDSETARATDEEEANDHEFFAACAPTLMN